MEFPRLETERLILRNLRHTDVPRIVEFAADKEIADNVRNLPHPYAEKDAIFWLNLSNQGFVSGQKAIFAVALKDSDLFIGGCGLHINSRDNHAEVGYWMAKHLWGKGYITEALGAVIKYGFEERKLHKILATHFVENIGSGRVMLKNGMTQEAVLKDHVLKDGVYRTLIQNRILRSEYKTP
ncbi:MAG: GNAT family N-acetyltransferase [Bacteroidota bacterium]